MGRFVLVALTLLGMSGCRAREAAPVPAPYPPSPRAGPGPRPEEITEVILRRDPGLGPLLMVRHLGDIHLRRPSEPSRERERFDLLAKWLVAQGFFDLKESYHPDSGFDGPSLEIAVVLRSGRKTVRNGRGPGDEATWAFETMIGGVAADFDRLAKERAFLDRPKERPANPTP